MVYALIFPRALKILWLEHVKIEFFLHVFLKTLFIQIAAWMPPEMIRYQPHSFPVDIWSFGICMLEVANQGPAIKGNDLYVMYTIGTQGLANTLQKPEKWSEDFKNFINKCLVMDPLERSTADDLLDVKKNYSFFLKNIFFKLAPNSQTIYHKIKHG